MSEICCRLHQLFLGIPKFKFPFEWSVIPKNGIYVLFEKGEIAHDVDRIVRVGTHTGNDQLRSRLKQHFITENKDRSIFRKNIGRAILKKDGDDFLEQWEIDLTTREAKRKYVGSLDFTRLQVTEKRVTEYIQRNFQFITFSVEEKIDRLQWESRLISTISLCDECHPSASWLGSHSPKDRISESGLWLVNELYKQPLSEGDYEVLKSMILNAM